MAVTRIKVYTTDIQTINTQISGLTGEVNSLDTRVTALEEGGGSGGKEYQAGEGIIIANDTISVDESAVALKGDSYTKLESDNKYLTEQDISGKADVATTLAGYGILDGVTFEYEDEPVGE